MRRVIAFFLATCMAVVGINAHAAHWVCNPHDYQYDMTAYVQLRDGASAVDDLSNYEVAAFAGDECRGVAQWVTTADGNHRYGLVRLWSNVQQGETLRWKVYDIKSHKERTIYNSEVYLAFEAQAVAGLPSAPIVLNLQAQGQSTVAGDVNGDGVVTAADITALYDYLLNNETTNLVNGDQNGDGNITAADITAVYDVLLGNVPVSVPGDVNGDGVVTAADITALYDYLLNYETTNLVNGDQNGDGNITAADITAVYTIMLGY